MTAWEPPADLVRALGAAPWRFAVTYARTAPHWYIIEHQAPDLVRTMAEAILTHGYDGTWRGHPFRYLNVDGYKYWFLTPVLNREPLPGAGLPGPGEGI